MSKTRKVFSLTNAAQECGAHDWQIRQAIRRGFLEEPQRVGLHRVFFAEDLPLIREALERAGYLQPQEAVTV